MHTNKANELCYISSQGSNNSDINSNSDRILTAQATELQRQTILDILESELNQSSKQNTHPVELNANTNPKGTMFSTQANFADLGYITASTFGTKMNSPAFKLDHSTP